AELGEVVPSQDAVKQETTAESDSGKEQVNEATEAESVSSSMPVLETAKVDESAVADVKEQDETSEERNEKSQSANEKTTADTKHLTKQALDKAGSSESKQTTEHGEPSQVTDASASEEPQRSRDRRQSDDSRKAARSISDRENTVTQQSAATVNRQSPEKTFANVVSKPNTDTIATTVEAKAATGSANENVQPAHTNVQSALDNTLRANTDSTGENQAASARGANTKEHAPQTVHVDRAKFVRRVAQAFEAAAERNGIVRMRLRPPELGSLRLELQLRNGVLTARLEAETSTARRLLVEHLPALRERLDQQNIRVERFDVDLMGNGLHHGGQETPGERQTWQAPTWNRGGARIASASESDDHVDTTITSRRPQATDFDVLA
ncbi:MAG: flagellar hook-length control protein FliK, partial [Planctomycetota bacterium]